MNSLKTEQHHELRICQSNKFYENSLTIPNMMADELQLQNYEDIFLFHF